MRLKQLASISNMRNSNEKNNRIEWVDVAKAIAIILVGVGHYGPGAKLHTWIYSFHMPLFFMLSGVNLNVKKYNFIKFVLRKGKTLLFPWIIFTTLDALLQSCYRKMGVSANDYNIFNVPGKLIINLRHGDWDPIYWFLPCLFLAEVLIFLMIKILGDNNKNIVLSIFVLFIIAFVYKKMIGRVLPWEIDLMPVVIPFVLIGFLYRKSLMRTVDLWKDNKKIIFSIICLITGSVIGFYNAWISGEQVNINEASYGDIVLMIAGAILISFGIILAASFVHIRIVNYIGKNSMLFYLLQPNCYKITDIVLVLFFSIVPFYTYKSCGTALDTLMIHICTNIVIIVLVYMLNKTKKYYQKKWIRRK